MKHPEDAHPSRRDGTVPDYVSAVMEEIGRVELAPVSQAVTHRSEAPVVVSVVRNERRLMPEFFLHYRMAGVHRFIVIDNASTDGTLDYAVRQPDVDVFSCASPFHWQAKQAWINRIIQQNGLSRWYIYADADEHIVFHRIGTLTFEDFARRMDEIGVRRVRGMLVDMYADAPLLEAPLKPGQRLADAFPYFDRDGFVEDRYRELISRKGGPRQRAFGAADLKFRPELTKYPMFKPLEGDLFANPHHHWPYPDNFDTPCYLSILHYKFLPNLASKIKYAIEETTYWNNSLEYSCYRSVLSENPKLSLMGSMSTRYSDPSDLVQHGIIVPQPQDVGASARTEERIPYFATVQLFKQLYYRTFFGKSVALRRANKIVSREHRGLLSGPGGDAIVRLTSRTWLIRQLLRRAFSRKVERPGQFNSASSRSCVDRFDLSGHRDRA